MGISKEVLRKWEVRYGFPVPERDASGNRCYCHEQSARLKLIKRLIDHGLRPAQVVALDQQSLHDLLLAHAPAAPAVAAESPTVAALLDLLRQRDCSALTSQLSAELQRLGLEKFVLHVMAPLNTGVGQAWERGEIGIRDEHVYTEVVQNLLREALSAVRCPDGLPRILLTTATGETHALGLLMVEALTSLHGAYCTSLGVQTPLEEISHAIRDYCADVVCLSFSTAFPSRQIRPYLKTLRGLVPPSVEIWVGGAGVAGLDATPRGVRLLGSLDELGDTVRAHRQRRRKAAVA